MVKFRFMVFNTTFNNIAVISWRSVLLVEETIVPGKNHDLSQVTTEKEIEMDYIKSVSTLNKICYSFPKKIFTTSKKRNLTSEAF